jgi:hypothetical protein
MRVSIGIVGALVTGVILLAGRGAAGDRDQQVAEVAARFLAATGQGDAATACSMLTPDTRDGLSTSDGTSCVEALPADRLSPAPVGGSQVWSDWAKVDTQAGKQYPRN